MSGFAGQTAVVTGAGHGIGRAIAHAFAEEGARVWACDIRAEVLEETRRSSPHPERVRTVLVDVRDSGAAAAFVQRAAQDGGSVHVLVHSAGGVQGQTGRPVEEVSDEDWRDIFAVNADAAFYMARAVAPFMKAQRYGRIVTISSGAGLRVSLTGIQAYAAAKAAQLGLTRQLAHELGPYGVTVNAVAPGFVLSNPSSVAQWEAYGRERRAAILEGVALRRLGTPEDIADGVLFLASARASWITGQVLSIDGGH